jgi:hypothetical protein
VGEREREGIYGSLVYHVTENAAEEGGDKGKIIEDSVACFLFVM